jgi:hypothetical protein
MGKLYRKTPCPHCRKPVSSAGFAWGPHLKACRRKLLAKLPKRATSKKAVLAKYPQAACIAVSECTLAVFKSGVLSSADLLGMSHTERGAWATAAKHIARADSATKT